MALYHCDVCHFLRCIKAFPNFTLVFVLTFNVAVCGPVFSYKLRYIVDLGLVEMAKLRYIVDLGLVEMAKLRYYIVDLELVEISTNPKLTIYRNLYENTGTSYDICLRICLDGHLDQSEGYAMYRNVYENIGTAVQSQKAPSADILKAIHPDCRCVIFLDRSHS